MKTPPFTYLPRRSRAKAGHHSLITFLVLVFLSTTQLLNPSTLFDQGSLTPPPGPPAPTMKTLDQIDTHVAQVGEARTPIDAAHTTTAADFEFVIDQAGSYYLTGNLNVAKNGGIHITHAGVTVDLNGFQIAHTSGGGHGILVEADNCTIRNGSVTGFVGTGVFGSARGGAISHVIASNCFIGLLAGDGWRIDSCNAHDNATDGIRTGPGCTISYCSAVSNAGNGGIVIGAGSTMVDCSASGNQGLAGISTADGCTLTHCTATVNTSAGPASAGILTNSGCTITACTVVFNTSTNVTPTGTTGAGISVGSSSKVQNCSAFSNKGDGIRAPNDCSIVANVCAANGLFGDGAGVHVNSSDNRIEGNNVTSNDRGIDVDSGGNLIIKNSASGNTGSGMPSANYDIVASNFVGTIVTTEATMNSATNSNINISF